MFVSAIRYAAQHPSRALAVLSRPISAWDILRDRMVQSREHKRPPYNPDADPDWERKLNEWLGVKLPTETRAEFGTLWPQVNGELQAQHIATGVDGLHDGDRGFVRAIWRLARHLRPVHVVETGVAHGLTSRFILEAMERNRAGHLWSIDRAPLDPAIRKQIGAAVGRHLLHRWTLIEGASRRRLPPLLDRLGQIDLFVHDSLHTERNVRFELNRAWDILRPGGAIVVDDIDTNWGFNAFVRTHRDFRVLICEAEPGRPDARRFNGKGLFGIILKNPSADRRVESLAQTS
ncbi:MAG TPA: class I SAM-dependent methyltransferase [Rhizomicrobium sp.]